VRITTLPTTGTLTDNGLAVTAGQFISASDISGGKLRYAPPANKSGSGLSTFTFQLQDDGGTAGGGVDLEAAGNAHTVTVNVTSVNDAPTGANKAVTTLEDTDYAFQASDFGSPIRTTPRRSAPARPTVSRP